MEITKQTPQPQFDNIVDEIINHEGLIDKQTPFRITNPEMKKWTKIHGYEIDNTAKKPANRENFIFLKNSEDVPKAVKQQFIKYATTPNKYGLRNDVTLKDALNKFDQSGAKGKIEFLMKKFPNLDLNQPLKNML